MKDKECGECILKGKCIYSYVFETPPPPDTKMMRKYEAAPHPFVIEPPLERKRGYKPGDNLTFGLVLIGKAIEYLPYFIYTFDELGKVGIGKGKGKFVLMQVTCGDETIYHIDSKTVKSFKTASFSLDGVPTDDASPGKLRLSLLTPTRLFFDGQVTFEIEFHMLVRNLLRRLSLLCYFHCNGDPSSWDFKGMIDKANEVQVTDRKVKWYDWERYSGRQDRRIKMGGLVGDITFSGDLLPFMPLINAGEVVHVGKGATFGLGKYSVV